MFLKGQFKNNEFTILNFWASWCSPCRKEHPNLVRLSKITNLKLVGINFKDDKSNAKNFLQENGNPFDILAKDKLGKAFMSCPHALRNGGRWAGTKIP